MGCVIRDSQLLAAGAELLCADMARVLGPQWSCTFSSDELRISDGSNVDVGVAVRMEFDPEEALPPGALESEWRDAELSYDAINAIVEAAQSGLIGIAEAWPICSVHAQALVTCSGVWVCGTGGHDPAAVGELTVDALT